MKKLVLFLFFLGFVLSAYSATWERVYQKNKWGDVDGNFSLRQVSTGVVNKNGSSKSVTTYLILSSNNPCSLCIVGTDDYIFPVILYEDEFVSMSFRTGDRIETGSWMTMATSNFQDPSRFAVVFLDMVFPSKNISNIIFDDSFDVLIEGKDWYLRSSFSGLPLEPESLWFAIRTGNIDYVKKIIERSENLGLKQNILDNYFTPKDGIEDDLYYNLLLSAVISVKNLDILNLLIQNGYDIKRVANAYFPVAVEDSFSSNVEEAESNCAFLLELLDLGLNPNVTNGNEKTPLANRLRYSPRDDSKLVGLKLQCLRKMIECGLNIKDPLFIPLMSESLFIEFFPIFDEDNLEFEKDNIECIGFIEELFKMGFSADYSDKYNEGALFDVWWKVFSIAKYVSFFEWVLERKYEEECLEYIRLFIEHGANINQVNYKGETCLLQMVKTLTLSEKNYSLSKTTIGGGLPAPKLSITADLLNFFIPELLRFGADVTVRDCEGKSAIDYISEYEAEHDGEVNAFNLIKAEYQKHIAK